MAEKTNDIGSDAIAVVAGAHDELAERRLDDATEEKFAGEPNETEHIKAQIEETRHQMGETIDALQERLSFDKLSEHVTETVNNAIETAKDTAYDATIGKAVNIMKNVGDEVTQTAAFKTVKRNPLPFALIGIGAGILAYQAIGGKNRSSRSFAKRPTAYGSGYGDESKFESARKTVESAAERAYDGVAETANSAYDKVTSAAGSAYGSISNAAGSAYDTVTHAVSDAYSSAGDFASRAYEKAGEYGTIAHDRYDEYIEENPLAVGAVALAVGAAVGFAIPSSKYEGRLMGEARDNLMTRAHGAAGELVERAKQSMSEPSTSTEPQRVH